MALSLGSELRHVGNVSELAFHHLRIFQLLPRKTSGSPVVSLYETELRNRGYV